jgi:hypothetical protein
MARLGGSKYLSADVAADPAIGPAQWGMAVGPSGVIAR